MDLAHVAGLDDERGARTEVLVDETVVDRRSQEQTRDRREFVRDVAVRKDHDVGPGSHVFDDLAGRLLDREGQSVGGTVRTVRVEQAVNDHGRETRDPRVLFDVADLGQFFDAEHRRRQDDLATVFGRFHEQVLLAANGDARRGHEFLANGVERRIGHLGEELGEEIKEGAVLGGQRGHRRVRAH